MPELSDEELARRVREAPRTRDFRSLGWTLILLPLDVFPSRTSARVHFGVMFGFEPDEICDLRARRLAMDGEPERTWWVLAVRIELADRHSRQ